MRSFIFILVVLSSSSYSHGAQACSGEVKVLLSPETVETVITSLKVGKESGGRVYFFDTEKLELLKRGLIVRVRQGANNDLTIKVRVPGEDKTVDTNLRQHFPCEVNRTEGGDDTEYSVRSKYKVLPVPDAGRDVASVLTQMQKKLLRDAGISIDWGRVKRVANVKVTKWEAPAQSPFGKLTLEMWEWPKGNILELSTKIASDAGPSKYAEFQRFVDVKGLSLSPNQGAKTSIVLETLTNQTHPLR